jgi:hypothetical protein
MKNIKINHYLNGWIKYGQWRHPKEWWQHALIEYIKITCPEKLIYNPTIIDISTHKIILGMKKHMGRLILSKTKIMEVLCPELN